MEIRCLRRRLCIRLLAVRRPQQKLAPWPTAAQCLLGLSRVSAGVIAGWSVAKLGKTRLYAVAPTICKFVSDLALRVHLSVLSADVKGAVRNLVSGIMVTLASAAVAPRTTSRLGAKLPIRTCTVRFGWMPLGPAR